MQPAYDVVVVGAGLVGLATAYRLLQQRPGLRMAVLDKEPTVGVHQSGHNSGVLHAGVYYPPGSLKAELCVRGKREMEAFATAHGIPYERCGKLIVASNESELGRLSTLHERGRANGVEGLREIGAAEIRDYEPHAVGVRALHVASTGIIDFGAVAIALAADVLAGGGDLLLGRRLEAIGQRDGTRLLTTTDGETLTARLVVTCAGLHADRIARMTAPESRVDIVPFRGDYYTLTPAASHLVRGLIYPVPDPALPFLGVHLTKRIDGEVWAGPNAVLALAREGYRRRDFAARDMAGTVRSAGFRRLARRFWRIGASEMWRDVVKAAFLRDLQRYVPALQSRDMTFGPSGVRAQAVDADGALIDDFRLIEESGVLHVLNAPSPAATASLAIGDVLAGKALAQLAG